MRLGMVVFLGRRMEMENNPLVSVIIPNYNYARYLEEAIKSVQAQTHSNTEIIVVNNGSTDDSLHLLQQFGSQITLINQENYLRRVPSIIVVIEDERGVILQKETVRSGND